MRITKIKFEGTIKDGERTPDTTAVAVRRGKRIRVLTMRHGDNTLRYADPDSSKDMFGMACYLASILDNQQYPPLKLIEAYQDALKKLA